jgi:hypothetical protein
MEVSRLRPRCCSNREELPVYNCSSYSVHPIHLPVAYLYSFLSDLSNSDLRERGFFDNTIDSWYVMKWPNLREFWAILKAIFSASPGQGGGSSPQDPGNPPDDTGGAEYLVRLGHSVDRTLKVPCSLSFTITDKALGTPEREEVIVWAVSAGDDWAGGNPAKGVFSLRLNDYDANMVKCKVYGKSGEVTEPKLACNWQTPPTHLVRVTIERDAVRVTVGSSSATISCNPGKLITLCYGDPRSRKAAVGAKLTGITWEGAA